MTCAACETSRLNAKAAGHRDWRTGVCWTHAAVDLDAWLSEHGYAVDSPEQPDLFGAMQ